MVKLIGILSHFIPIETNYFPEHCSDELMQNPGIFGCDEGDASHFLSIF